MTLTDTFRSDGFVIACAFAAEQIDNIAQRVERLISESLSSLPNNQVFFDDKSDRASLKQVQRLHEHDDFFGSLATNSPFSELAEQLLGESVTCQNLQYFNKPPRTSQPTPPHQDGYYFCLKPPSALTMWLALDDADEDNGCVRYVRGSHRNGIRDHQLTHTLGFSQGIAGYPTPEDLKNEVAIPAKRGDLLAHHALVIHRADANRNSARQRRALGFIYYGESAAEDPVARAEYLKRVEQNQSGLV